MHLPIPYQSWCLADTLDPGINNLCEEDASISQSRVAVAHELQLQQPTESKDNDGMETDTENNSYIASIITL